MALPPFLVGEDLLKFRTRHCERFVKQGRCHFGEKCQYSHDIEWTRRPLWKYNYAPQLCHFVHSVPSSGRGIRLQHTCCLHRQCPLSHSREEQMYHPKVYKRVLCERFMQSRCPRYYCPFAHGVGELQGPSTMDSTVQELMRTPQDMLSPLGNIPSNHTALFFSKDVLHHDAKSIRTPGRVHFETVSECTTSSGGTPSSALSIRQTPACRMSDNIAALLTQTSAKQLPALDRLPYHLPLSQNGWVRMTSTILYDARNSKHEELYIPLDPVASPICITKYNGTFTNVCPTTETLSVFHIKTSSPNDLQPIHSKLQKLTQLSHRNLTPIYSVHLKPTPLHAPDSCEACKSSGLWTAVGAALPQCLPEVNFLEEISVTPSPSPLTKISSAFPTTLESVLGFLRGLATLHSAGIRHGLITPSTIQVDHSTGAVQLAQLVYAALPLSVSHVTLSHLMCQSPQLLSATATKNNTWIEENRSLASDVWSAGICIFTWLTAGYVHPHGNSPQAILENIICDNKVNLASAWETRSPLLYNLLLRMLDPNPHTRITIHNALQHPVFWKYQEPGHYVDQLCTIIRATTETTSPTLAALYSPLGWMDALLHDTAEAAENDALTRAVQLVGLTVDNQLHFVLQSLGRLDMMHGPIPLLEHKENVAAVVSAISQQSSIGLAYFLCLLYNDGQLDIPTRHRVIEHLITRYADAVIATYVYILKWKSESITSGRSTSSYNTSFPTPAKPVPVYRETAYALTTNEGGSSHKSHGSCSTFDDKIETNPLPEGFHDIVSSETSTLTSAYNGQTSIIPFMASFTPIRDAKSCTCSLQQPSLFSHHETRLRRTEAHASLPSSFPGKPVFLDTATHRLDDTLDGESTTTSSVCPHFVQSLLSFMTEEA